MKIQVLECPKCHATLENDNESLGTFFCKYCGQDYIELIKSKQKEKK